ncbi:MAG: hypothetical protein HOI70_04495, partial [Opitutae bacterium]|nr:hypothetical protein [Opitutae bacterium]
MFTLRALLVFCVLSQFSVRVHAITYPSGGNGSGVANNPIFPGLEENDLTIILDGNLTGNPSDSYENWALIPGSGPFQKGTSNGSGTISLNKEANSSFTLVYSPLAHFEGNATFDLNSSALGTGANVTHSFTIEMVGTNDSPKLKFRNSANVSEVAFADASYQLDENKQLAAYVLPFELDAGDVVTLSLPSGVNDNDRFTVDQGTGQIKFISNSGANFETPLDLGNNNTYIITVNGIDLNNSDVNQTVTITIDDIDEAPSIQPNGGLTKTISEDHIDTDANSFYNVTKSSPAGEYFLLSVTDPDASDVSNPKWSLSTTPSKGRVYYSITSGSLFPMGTLNELTTASSVSASQIWIDYHPDTNATTEGGLESFTIKVEDQDNPSLFEEFTITLTITPVNDDFPSWVTTLGSYSVIESNASSSHVLVDLDATDPDLTDTLTFSKAGGDDASFFTIDGSTGQLRFANLMNYEDKSDSNGDDIYHVIARVTDGAYNKDFPISIQLLDEAESPQIQEGIGFSSTFSLVEGNSWTMPVGFITGADVDFGPNGKTGGADSSDDDNNTLVWSTSSVPSQGGVITWANTVGQIPSFTYTPQNSVIVQFPDSNQSQTESFTISVRDADGLSVTKTLTATVSPVPDPPLIWKFQRQGIVTDVSNYATSQRLTFQYPENSSAATPIQIFVYEYDGEP